MKDKKGLITYLTLYKDQLEHAPDDKAFFQDLGQFMRSISANPFIKPLLEKLAKEQKESKDKLKKADKERYLKMKSLLDKLSRNKLFPKDDPVIQGIANEFGKKEAGLILSAELNSQAAHYAVLKILERLDELSLTDLTKEWRVEDENSDIKYTIAYDFQKFDEVKQNDLLEEESTAWGAYSELIVVPLVLYDFQEYLEETKGVSGPELWTRLNLVGIAGEMRKIFNGDLAQNREKPYFFKRDLFFHYFLKLRNYLISNLEGFSTEFIAYDDARTTIEIPGLLMISEKDVAVKYIGVNGEKSHKYTLHIQPYVLLLSLAKADGYKLSIDSLFTILSDPKKCDYPIKKNTLSSNYNLIKSVRRSAIIKLGFTEAELWIVKNTNMVGLTPQSKKKKGISS